MKLKDANAEEVRVHLLEKYGIGTISINSTDLRVTFSCVEEQHIEELFDLIAKGVAKEPSYSDIAVRREKLPCTSILFKESFKQEFLAFMIELKLSRFKIIVKNQLTFFCELIFFYVGGENKFISR